MLIDLIIIIIIDLIINHFLWNFFTIYLLAPPPLSPLWVYFATVS